jgi:hypothetical protein
MLGIPGIIAGRNAGPVVGGALEAARKSAAGAVAPARARPGRDGAKGRPGGSYGGTSTRW